MKSEHELVEAALRGDPAAFAALVVPVRPRLSALVARVVGADEAEDVVQEALLRAYLGLSRLRDPDRFAAWLCGIGINVAKMRRRSLGARARAVAAAGAAPAAAPEADELDVVRDAVAVLAPAQRDVVLLHYVDDLSCDEIARLLGTSPGAVRVRLHRARAQLRRELAPLGITAGQAALLHAIRTEPGIGVRELASREGMSAPTMSAHVDRLEAAGLVTRTRSGADRRRVRLELTENGLRVLRAARSRRTAWLASRLKHLTPAELAALEAALEPLSRLLEEDA